MSQVLENIRFFTVCFKEKNTFMMALFVRHDAKRFKILQTMAGSWSAAFPFQLFDIL